ncbi:MAG TPA: ADP-ribosyltransferase, partial [Gaiellaceae bacterium]|jgi:hypothetical protein|nr:ADP-ribosyltransferase [Gaiellaceae bacterium]
VPHGTDLTTTIGKQFSDDGFVSTSTSEEGFSSPNSPTTVIIQAPAGTPGIWMNAPMPDGSLGGATLSQFPLEREFLLDRSLTYEVVDVKTSGTGVQTPVLKVVPTAAAVRTAPAAVRTAITRPEARSVEPSRLDRFSWGPGELVPVNSEPPGLSDTYQHPTGAEHDAGTNFPAD